MNGMLGAQPVCGREMSPIESAVDAQKNANYRLHEALERLQSRLLTVLSIPCPPEQTKGISPSLGCATEEWIAQETAQIDRAVGIINDLLNRLRT